MTITNQGLPIHNDATFAVRPRTFLEGNFFVDVSPGTPEAPVASSGHTFPIQQGIVPVQFDQVLTGLQDNTRQNLQTLLKQFGIAVKQGGPAYNQSIQYWSSASSTASRARWRTSPATGPATRRSSARAATRTPPAGSARWTRPA
jgi:ABC-type transporter Mla subunit MlaD